MYARLNYDTTLRDLRLFMAGIACDLRLHHVLRFRSQSGAGCLRARPFSITIRMTKASFAARQIS